MTLIWCLCMSCVIARNLSFCSWPADIQGLCQPVRIGISSQVLTLSTALYLSHLGVHCSTILATSLHQQVQRSAGSLAPWLKNYMNPLKFACLI